jgi:competence protein ComEC
MMHLLAISGLHLGILLAGLWFGLRALRLRTLITVPVVATAACGLLWLIGPRISLLRATTMLIFLGGGAALADAGWLLRRWVEPLQALAAALFIALLLAPWGLLEAGLQLSFAATLALVLVLPRNGQSAARHGTLWECVRDRLGAACGNLLDVSLLAHLGTAPLIAFHFGTYHPLSVVANFVAVPVVTAALWMGLVIFLCLPVGARGVFTPVLDGTLQLLVRLSDGAADLAWASVTCTEPVAIWCLGFGAWALAVRRTQSSLTWKSISIASS